ncbi:MAG: PilW family protein, partial [Chromatocurvus sp.]
SLVLGVFVVGGVLSVFVGGLETFRMTDSLSRMQESGRYSLERLRRDLRQAGFFGCRNTLTQENPRNEGPLDPGLIRNTLNPAPSGGSDPLDFEFDFGTPLVGYEATGSVDDASWTGVASMTDAPLDPQSLSLITGTLVPGSDIVVMVRAVGSGLRVDAHPGGNPPGSANVQVAANNGLQQGDIVFATDCESGGIFAITNANPDTSGSLVHNTGNSDPGNYTKALGRTFVGAEIFRIERAVYYVAESATTGRPSLFRNDEEIAENVEQLQVVYGVDASFDTRVDDYLTAQEIATSATVTMDNVLAIRADLLISSGEEDNFTERAAELTFAEGTFTADADDRRLYRAFIATVGVRNRMP